MNGNTGTWLTRGLTLSALVAIIGMLMAQSFDKGKMLKGIEHNTDTNTALEERIEKRDERFDKYLLQQTRRSIIDSLNTVVLMRFLDRQMTINDRQTDFNEMVKEHILTTND